MTTTTQEGASATARLSDLGARWGPRLSFLVPLAGLIAVQRLLFPAPLGVSTARSSAGASP
jgi:hypothetical protein